MWNRWQVALVAALTSVVLMMSFAGSASATEPGEEASFHDNHVGGQLLQLRGTLSEARQNDGTLLQAWRGADNDAVWLSINGGNAFTLGNTATTESPTVIPYGNTSYMVFHVGTDNRIYYTNVWVANGQPNWWGFWTTIPGQTTGNAVSVVQLANPSVMYVVYRSSTDDRVFGTRYNGIWSAAQNIDGGLSPQSPRVYYNSFTSRIYAALRGEDNNVWLSTSSDQGSSWTTWRSISRGDSSVAHSPAINGTPDGNMVAAYTGFNWRPYYRRLDAWGNPREAWQRTADNWQTNQPVNLSLTRDQLEIRTHYRLMNLETGLDGASRFKILIDSLMNLELPPGTEAGL